MVTLAVDGVVLVFILCVGLVVITLGLVIMLVIMGILALVGFEKPGRKTHPAVAVATILIGVVVAIPLLLIFAVILGP